MKMRYFYIATLLLLLSFCMASRTYAELLCTDISSNSASGILYDPGGSSDYSNNQNCGFLIQPIDGGDITLTFKQFNYENNYDYVYIYDGTDNSGTLLGTFTGNSIPNAVTAVSGAMYIVHSSDNFITASGFTATWSTAADLSPPIVEWQFDEPSWDGTANEVIDNQGFLSGFAVNGATTQVSGQVCGSASFDGVDDYLSVNGLHTYLRTTASLSFWIKTSQLGDDTVWLAPGITGVEQSGGADDIFWGWLDASGRISLSQGDNLAAQSSTTVATNTWHHVVLTRNATNGELHVYLNGTLISVSTEGAIGDINTMFSSIGRIEDTSGTPEYFNGDLDEVLIFNRVINAATVQTIYNNQSAGHNWDGSSRACAAQLVAQWRFEEISWDGSLDEVRDSSGNDYHGQLLFGASSSYVDPVVPGVLGTCVHGDFRAGGSIGINDLPVSTNDGVKTTVTFWMKWDGVNYVMPIGWNTYNLWFKDGSFGFNTFNNDIYGISSSSLLNTWRHVTAEFTNGSNALASNRLWIDGVEQILTQREATPSSGYRSVGNSFRIGGDTHSTAFFFTGYLDEVKIYNGQLTTSQVQNIMNETYPCRFLEPVSYFSIIHDNNGIYCADESIVVSAHRSDASVLSTYTDTITLDTQTGKGTWSLLSGNGIFVDSVNNDGLATYTFSGGDGGTASFHLFYDEGVSAIDVDIYDDSARDDDSEGNLVYSPTGFTITANPLSNPPVTPINDPISVQSSGQEFSIAIAAYGIDADSGQCGIIETYTGNKTLSLMTDYVNPITGSLSLSGSGVATFSNGQAVVNTQYNDVGQISVVVSDTAANMFGRSNPFVVKPVDFSIAVSSNPATTNAGSGFVSAGTAFTVDIQALNALGNVTPNFGKEQVPESVRATIDSLVFPTGGDIGILSNADAFVKSGTVENVFTNTSMTWNQVGSMRLVASIGDGDYLGEGNVTSSPSETIGRFYPDSILLNTATVSNSCSSFTYFSEPNLGLQYSLSAIGVAGNTVTNYDAGLGYPVGTIQYGAEHNNNGTDLGGRLNVGTAQWSAGDYLLVDNQALMSRASSIEAPLETVQLSVYVDDVDNTPMNAANAQPSSSVNCANNSSCTHSQLGNATFYYGRLRLVDAYGPESANLPVTFTTEYWDGNRFVTNTADNCTTLARSLVSLNNQVITTNAALTVDLDGGTTTANFANIEASHITFTNGDAGLFFSAPGVNINEKSFLMDVDMSTLDWLTGDWNLNGDLTDDADFPTSIMSFKTYRGHDRILYWRHKY